MAKASWALLFGGLLTSAVAVAQTTSKQAQSILPSIMMLLEDEQEPISLEEAARFLIQATYGPNYEEVVALTNSSYEAWLDRQFSLAPTLHLDYARNTLQLVDNNDKVLGNGRTTSWLLVSANGQDQLRQRMAFALSELFVVSNKVTNGIRAFNVAYVNYYDLLLNNAFGNFRDLLYDVTLSPVMGQYLSMAGNQRRNLNANPPIVRPDENFAREIMQLFTIGLYELNLDGTPKLDQQGNRIPTYTQDDVSEFAKVFTGFHYNNATGIPARILPDLLPMRAFPDAHDETQKKLLNGVVLPAGQSTIKDLNDALDNLFNHPNVGPFICKQLIQKFVTSNPSPRYVRDCALSFNLDTGRSNRRGDLKRVLRTILLHNEARTGHKTMPNTFGKIKEPLIQLVGVWRAMHITKRGDFTQSRLNTLALLNQFPLEAQTVFNFFTPDFSPNGAISEKNLLAPEAQLFNTESVVSMSSTYSNMLNGSHLDSPNGKEPISLDTLRFYPLIPDDLKRPEQFVEQMNIVLLAGTMPPDMREKLLSMHNQLSGYVVNNKLQIIKDIIRMISLSPYARIQR